MSEEYKAELGKKSNAEIERLAKELQYYGSEEKEMILQELQVRRAQQKEDCNTGIPNLSSKENKKEEVEERHAKWMNFIPHDNYLASPLIAYLNIFIFIVMCLAGVHFIDPTVEDLITWGGNLRHLTTEGDYWRLISSTFVHAGVIHLLFNMYALIYIGVLLEPGIGWRKFVFTYVLTGLFASLCSLGVNDNIVSVGASGAVFGLYGLALVLFANKSIALPDSSDKKSLMTSVITFVGYNLLLGFAEEGIDNAAHIGGLLSGAAIGVVLIAADRVKLKTPFVYIGVAGVFLIGASLVFSNVSNSFGDYEAMMMKFADNESKALWVYHEDLEAIPANEIDAFNARIESESIELWRQNIALLDSLQEWPESFVAYEGLLREYCEIRIECLESVQELLSDQSQMSSQSFEETHKRLEDKLKELEMLAQ